MVLNLDCIYILVHAIGEKFDLLPGQVFVLHLIRFCILTINGTEICLTFMFVILIFISGLLLLREIFTNFLNRVKCPAGNANDLVESLTFTHIQVQLAIKSFACYQELGVLALMTVGLLVFIFSNFATVRFFGVVPFVVFVFFPSVSFLVALIVNFTLPLTHKQYEDSIELLRRSAGALSPMGRGKYLRRKIRAVRPHRLSVGVNGSNMFCLNRETKVEYFQNAIYYTITLLLSVQH